MTTNLKPHYTILFILSDVNNSPQLIAILQKFRREMVDFKLIILGVGHSKLCDDLHSLEIPYSLSAITSKYGIPGRFLFVLTKMIFLKPEVVYASGQFATLVGMSASFLARVPIRVFTRHHSNFHHYYNMKLGVIADRISNLFATKIIAVSKIVESILLSQEGVRKSKVKIIYNGIALNKFQNKVNNLDRTIGVPSKSTSTAQIGVISRLTELKGVTYTAEAFVKYLKLFPDAHLSLVGVRADSFSEVSTILSHIPSSSYNFVDFNQDIPQFLKSLDVLVHVPIAIDIESFGLVYLEALAVGVPSIFTLSGILNEIPHVEDYVQIVPYMNSEAIYLAMTEILNYRMTQKNRLPEQWLDRFDIEVMADLYFEEIFSSLSVNQS